MAGTAKLDLTPASPESGLVGSYQNGQRGYSGPSMDRSASFRDAVESRSFGSGKANSRSFVTSVGDVPVLSQCLMLEPIVLGDQKYARPSDLRRVLSFSVVNGSEENTYVAGHPKNSPPGSVDELKRLRATVQDTCVKASDRARKLDEHLNKLSKFEVVMSSKKPQRKELSTSERSSGSTVKIGSQLNRNTSELGIQKFDDRPKNGVLNKRARTSVADPRAESRNNGMLRQPSPVSKERDSLKETVDPDVAEEKIRRLPAAGEGWDKKMKRKRSVGTVFSRSVDNDGELKRTMNKLSSDSGVQTGDSPHTFRSGAYGGSNKLDPTSSSLSPVGSTARATLKSELEKSALTRDVSTGPIKERAIGKLNVKLNNREDNHPVCPGPIVKGKASRTPRNGSAVAANSAVSIPRVPGTLESWEPAPGLNKTPPVNAPNGRKRATSSTGPAVQPITQWGGQRPQKISRPRRSNVTPPVSNHDEAQMQPEGGSPSDIGSRFSMGTANSALLSKAANGNQNFKVKADNVPSPARLSESEESGAGENRIKEKGMASVNMEEKVTHAGQTIGSSPIPMKKNKILTTEETTDSARRQGRNGRVSPFSRSSVSPTREKLDLPTAKPSRNARTGTEKNGSKTGRPLKKLSERKGFSRLSHVAKGSSPDCSGESEDDHEELLTAANLAYKSSLNSCPSVFWKIVEDLFASVGPREKSYLSEQLKLAEDMCANSSQTCSNGENVQEDYGCEDIVGSDSLSMGRNRSVRNDLRLKDNLNPMDFVEQLQNSSLHGQSDVEKRYETVTPIYQRVLSALIAEDEIEELEETGFGTQRGLVSNAYLPNGTENKHMDRMDFCDPIFGVQAHKNGNGHIIFSCNGNTNFGGNHNVHDRLCNGDFSGDDGYVHSEVEVLVRLSRCGYNPQSLQATSYGISSFNCSYEQMRPEEKIVVELQSLDLFLEPVPPLDDKEDEAVDQHIVQLERELHEQSRKKKIHLDKVYKAVQERNVERRDPEQVAMDKLLELAYKKLLATRGSFATKHGIPRVSKQVAMAFVRRALARCRKFEDSGTSCFSEPSLRDIVYAPPPRFDEKELLAATNLAIANEAGGPISNRGRRKEVLLDDVGGAGFRGSSTLGISGGAKGKRSERDNGSARNASAKVNRMGGSKGERKTKSKPKQKTGQLSTSISAYPSGSGSGESAGNSLSKRKDVRFMSANNPPPVLDETSMDLDLPLKEDIDVIDGLGVDSDLGAPQDLNSWLNFEDDMLDQGDSIGLSIPMDDLNFVFS